MWDWKQLLWMKCLGWDVYDTEKGKLRKFLKIEGLTILWMMPATITAQIVFLILSFENGDFKDIIPCISEWATATRGTIKCVKWAFRGSDIRSIIGDIEDLDKRRKKYFKDEGNKYCDSVMAAHTKTCSKYLYLSIASILAASHWTVRPFVRAFYGDYIRILHDWVPWDDGVFFGWLIHFIHDGCVVVCCISGFLAYDSLVLSFNEMTMALVSSISYGLSNLKFETGNVRDNLKELHEMHKDALNITKKVKDFSNLIFQVDCLLFAFTTCCGVLEITRDWSSPHRKINTIEMIVVCGGFFYLQCHRCQMVANAYSNVASAAYDNDWYRGNNEDKRRLSIIVHMSRKPISFGSVIRIDLSAFIAVMKTSFSYYNALIAFDIH